MASLLTTNKELFSTIAILNILLRHEGIVRSINLLLAPCLYTRFENYQIVPLLRDLGTTAHVPAQNEIGKANSLFVVRLGGQFALAGLFLEATVAENLTDTVLPAEFILAETDWRFLVLGIQKGVAGFVSVLL
eukprot:scaffold36879_cov183-Amphora_coffeaeformis.AAC.1